MHFERSFYIYLIPQYYSIMHVSASYKLCCKNPQVFTILGDSFRTSFSPKAELLKILVDKQGLREMSVDYTSYLRTVDNNLGKDRLTGPKVADIQPFDYTNFVWKS